MVFDCDNQEGVTFFITFKIVCHFYLKTESTNLGLSCVVLSLESGGNGISIVVMGQAVRG